MEIFMTKDEFAYLQTGDVVRPKGSDKAYVVMDHYGDRVTVVRTSEISNPDEWLLIRKVIEDEDWGLAHES